MHTLAVHRAADGVAQVEMSNPAFDEVMLGELAETFEALGKDPAVRAIVLSGGAPIRVSPRRHSSAHVGCHLHSRNRCSQGAHPLPDLIDRQTGISEDEPSLTGPRTRRRTGEQR